MKGFAVLICLNMYSSACQRRCCLRRLQGTERQLCCLFYLVQFLTIKQAVVPLPVYVCVCAKLWQGGVGVRKAESGLRWRFFYSFSCRGLSATSSSSGGGESEEKWGRNTHTSVPSWRKTSLTWNKLKRVRVFRQVRSIKCMFVYFVRPFFKTAYTVFVTDVCLLCCVF